MMDVFGGAKGIIRSHGCRATHRSVRAGKSPWVGRSGAHNPIGSHMDADPATVISVLKEMGAGK